MSEFILKTFKCHLQIAYLYWTFWCMHSTHTNTEFVSNLKWENEMSIFCIYLLVKRNHSWRNSHQQWQGAVYCIQNMNKCYCCCCCCGVNTNSQWNDEMASDVFGFWIFFLNQHQNYYWWNSKTKNVAFDLNACVCVVCVYLRWREIRMVYET